MTIELWGIPIDGFMWFCVSGGSFFVACLLLMVCIVGALFTSKIWHNFLIYFAMVVSGFLIYMAAMPFSNMFYFAWGGVIVGNVLGIHLKSKKKIIVSIMAFSMTLLAVFLELPHYMIKSNPSERYSKLFVIGDSISDGMGNKHERTWPKIMVEEGYEVIDAARAGATSVTALRRQVHKVTDEEGIVLLELGGNDALMGTPHDEFEKALREILVKVVSDKHEVIMLEVPVLPWHIEYCRIMRKVANEFDVALIPKKFLARIFSAKDATVDLAHLSSKGHELMARQIFTLIGPPKEHNK